MDSSLKFHLIMQVEFNMEGKLCELYTCMYVYIYISYMCIYISKITMYLFLIY